MEKIERKPQDLNYSVAINDKNWKNDEIYRFLKMFLEFKVIPDLELMVDAHDKNQINLNITLKKYSDNDFWYKGE